MLPKSTGSAKGGLWKNSKLVKTNIVYTDITND